MTGETLQHHDKAGVGEISKTHLEEGKKIGGGRQPRGNTLLNLPDGPVLIQDVTTECRASGPSCESKFGLIIISLKREREEVNQEAQVPKTPEMNLVPSASWLPRVHSGASFPTAGTIIFFSSLHPQQIRLCLACCRLTVNVTSTHKRINPSRALTPEG